MKIIDKKFTISELKKMAAATFGNMVKAVVDVDSVRKKIISIVAKRIS